MITLTIDQMLNSIPALNELVETKINIVAAFNITRLITDINGEMKSFVKAKDLAISEFDLEDEKEMGEANKIVSELLDQEINLEHNELLPESLGASAVLKPRVLMALEWLFVKQEKAE